MVNALISQKDVDNRMQQTAPFTKFPYRISDDQFFLDEAR